jgi:hypothetical protein
MRSLSEKILLPSPNVCYVILVTSTLTICFIIKNKVMQKKIKCVLKLLYVINHIIFDFFITLIF